MTLPSELTEFLSELSGRRQRLLSLTGGPSANLAQLTQELDELAEQLIVADEELRVQQEEIQASQERLELLAAERDMFFQSSSNPYVVTDDTGVVLRTNRAADQLILRPSIRLTPRPIATWFDVDDRGRVRTMISRARRGEITEDAELQVRRRDGSSVPVRVFVEQLRDAASASAMLRWELRQSWEHAKAAPDADPDRTDKLVARNAWTSDAANHVAELVVELSRNQTSDDVCRTLAGAVGAHVAATLEVAVTLAGKLDQFTTILGGGSRSTPGLDTRLTSLVTAPGPTLETIGTRSTHVISDTSIDTRWPEFTAAVDVVGIRSVLCVPFGLPDKPFGAITLVSTQPQAFKRADGLLVEHFALHAAAALAHVRVEENLRLAIQSRQDIGQAVGIVMERQRVTADRAFNSLVLASQRTNIKLRAVAQTVVETGQDPESIGRG
jgi:PAS domain S-box-containing protein